jgi:hypothetical protein
MPVALVFSAGVSVIGAAIGQASTSPTLPSRRLHTYVSIPP